MRRIVVFVFAGPLLAAGAAHALPDRRPLEPETSKLPAPLDMRGTTWDCTNKAEDRLFAFQADGTLHYGGAHRNGVWRLEGNVVHVEINNAFRFFRGTVTGDVLEGESWNIRGTRWHTRLIRVPPK